VQKLSEIEVGEIETGYKPTGLISSSGAEMYLFILCCQADQAGDKRGRLYGFNSN
jgi:hypothetical protein